jgi:hypothetical protein
VVVYLPGAYRRTNRPLGLLSHALIPHRKPMGHSPLTGLQRSLLTHFRSLDKVVHYAFTGLASTMTLSA